MKTRRPTPLRWPCWISPLSLAAVAVVTGIAVAGWLHFFVERHQAVLNDRLVILERETQARMSWREELTAKVLENTGIVQEMRYRLASCGCALDGQDGP